jgi:AcrR family transcriptional regulator
VTTGDVAEAERRLGRPRSTEADRAILDAAIEQFVELGYDAITMEGVAARAGVGKATIYRRYPTKLDLVMAAAAQLGERKGPVPDTGSLRADLVQLARGYRRMLTGTDTGRAIPAMIAAKARCAELHDAHTRFVAERIAKSSVVVRRAVERGELPAGTDPEEVVELVFGPLFYRVLVSGRPVGDAYLERLVDKVLAGVGG